MAEKKDPAQLGRREREILNIVFRLGEASVGDVMTQMSQPQARSSARKSALSHLMATFFENSVADTMAAVLDLKSDDLSNEELAKLQTLIDKARREGR
jgi:predicted transcriptional regulator